MNRCALPRRTALLMALLAGWVVTLPATAQVVRNFPRNALRGEISFTNPPEILLNGDASRLSPGSRLHGQDNMLLVSGAATGQKVVVNYTVDQLGQPLEVWVLRASEIANTPWPRSLAESQAWSFDPAAQTWTKP
jgi:hypothetical protein